MAANRRGVPQNAIGGGLQAGLRPEEVDGARNVLSSAVAGRSYHPLFSSGRSDAAGYTTSSPGWRHDAPIADLFPAAPAGPPTDMSVAGPWGAGFGGGGGAAPRPGGDRGPQTTGAIPGPERAATPQMIANATTTPSALFEPFPTPGPTNQPNPREWDATSPSSLGSFLTVPGPSRGPSPPLQPLPPELQPARSTSGVTGPLPPEIVPAAAVTTPPAPAMGPGPSSVRPPAVLHPDNPTVGKAGPLGKGRAQTSKKRGQYSLRQEGDAKKRGKYKL